MPVSSGTSGASREASDPACPVCGGSERVPLLTARDHHYGNVGDFRLEGCAGCGLGMQVPMPSDAELAQFYPDDYPCHQWIGVDRPWLVRLRRWLFCDTLAREPRIERPGRMLDVGCGSGAALVRFRRLGWEAIGVEPDPRAVRAGLEQGLEIYLNRDRGRGAARTDLIGSSILRTLGQWSAALISIGGTGEVLDVTAVRPGDGRNP